MNPDLQHFFALAQAGRRQEAVIGLRDYLLEHIDDVEGWIILGGLTSDTQEGVRALEHALRLDPGNLIARRGLVALESRRFSVPPAEAVASPPPPVVGAVAGNAGAAEAAILPPVAVVPDLVVAPVDDVPAPLKTALPSEPGLPPGGVITAAEPQPLREVRSLVWPFQPREGPRRTLGELLDADLLTRQDLEWAARHAREPKVRTAAQTVLDKVHRLPHVALTEGEARLIAWPFRRQNRPLGELIDAGTVETKDLRWAAWFAPEPRLREAARVMLPLVARERRAAKPAGARGTHRPAQVTSPTRPSIEPVLQKTRADTSHRPMPVIHGSEYLTQQIRGRYRRQIAIIVAGMALAGSATGIALALAFAALVEGVAAPWWLWGVALLLIAPIFWLTGLLREVMREERSFRQGREGERTVARLLRQGLNEQWTLFLNVQLPGNRADMDMLLLGPPGLFVLEVKAYSGQFAYRRDRWYRKTMTGWRLQRRNPIRQARGNAGLLHTYIQEHLKKDLWVEPRLVWAGEGTLELEQPVTPVWVLAHLPEETRRLRELTARLSREDQAALSGLLRGLCSTLK